MTDILVGIVVGILGLILVFAGYAFARILLALWGFVFGIVLGGSLLNDFTSSGFLNTTLGIFLGIVLGLIFAALAYAFFYVAIVLSGAALGFVIGSSFLQLFGMDPNFLTTMLGIAVGIVMGFAFVILNLPRAYIIVVTAFSGAVIVIGGLLLIFNQIPLEYFSYKTAKVAVENSWFWSIGAIALAIFGIVVQAIAGRNTEIETWQLTGTKPATVSSGSDE